MTIASAFNEIAVAQGGAASKTGSIAGAIDALNDALAGSDQKGAETIEDAVRLLGDHIGGGSSVTVEALTATENKTYTAPSGKAYSPVTVNVSGGGSEWGTPVEVAFVNETGGVAFMLFQQPFDMENPPDTFIDFVVSYSVTSHVPHGMNCGILSEFGEPTFEIDGVSFTDYESNENMYWFQMPEGEVFTIAIGS